MKNTLFVTIFLCLFLVNSCSRNDDPSSDKPQAIVSFVKNVEGDYWKQIKMAIDAECAAGNCQSIVRDAKDDADIEGQLNDVSTFAELRKTYDIKGVIFAPIYTAVDHRPEQKLAELIGNEIPVIIIDSPVDESCNPLKNVIKAYVGTDNYEAGRLLAEAVNADASTVFAARIKNSIPSSARYDGFCKGIGSKVPIWETLNDLETPENFAQQLAGHPDAENLVFFNGHLCSSVLGACEGRNVYSFDAYKPFLESIKNGTGSVRGIVAQNTFEMGRLAVKAIADPNMKGDVFVPVIYISSKTIASKEARPFLDYFGIEIE